MLFTEINAAAATKALGRDWNGWLNSFTRHSRDNEGKRLSRTVHNNAKQTGRERQSRPSRVTAQYSEVIECFRPSVSGHSQTASSHTSRAASLLQSPVSLCHSGMDSSRLVLAFTLNPLDSKGNYSGTSTNTKFVHWPLMGGLLHLIQRGRAWAGCGPAQSTLRCTKYNSPPINGQCTNHSIAV